MAVSIDIERGVHHRSSKPAPPSVSRPGLPLLRRRKGLVIILCVSFLLLLGLNANRIPGAQSSITWVKDSMGRTDSAHLPTEPLPNDFSLNVASQAAAAEVSGGLARPGSGTDALKKLAEENGIDPAQLDKDVTAPGAKPTSSEWILLFLQALSNPAYQVPSWQTRWKKQLMPTSEKAFIGSLSEVTAGESAQDIALVSVRSSKWGVQNSTLTRSIFALQFKTDRARWNAAHQAQHPLTVFSKSYCPVRRHIVFSISGNL